MPWGVVSAELAELCVWYDLETGKVYQLRQIEERAVSMASREVQRWHIRVFRALKTTMTQSFQKIKTYRDAALESRCALGYIVEARSASPHLPPEDPQSSSPMHIDVENDIRTDVQRL